MTADQRAFNCPNCGGELRASLRFAKVVACDHCDSMVMLEDDALRLAGKQGVMADMPSLLSLLETFTYRGTKYTPIGHVRFEYAHGYWDEWWTLTPDDAVWISVDEGDIAIEKPITLSNEIDPAELRLGNFVAIEHAQFMVSEEGEAVCQAVRGEIPEALAPGDRYDYWDLSGSEGAIVTIERQDGVFSAHRGVWINPYEVVVQGRKSA